MRSGSRSNGRSRSRRGAMLPMALFQMFLMSVLLTIGGVCLHTALRSDRAERQSVLLLRTLTRLEQQLRADERDSRTVIVQSPTELVFNDLTDQRGLVTWRTERGFMERLEGALSSPNGRESYTFPAGYSVEFADESGWAVVRIREGLPLVKYRESGSGGLSRNSAAVPRVLPSAADGDVGGRAIEIRLRSGRGGVK
jgi:hypothetical protein